MYRPQFTPFTIDSLLGPTSSRTSAFVYNNYMLVPGATSLLTRAEGPRGSRYPDALGSGPLPPHALLSSASSLQGLQTLHSYGLLQGYPTQRGCGSGTAGLGPLFPPSAQEKAPAAQDLRVYSQRHTMEGPGRPRSPEPSQSPDLLQHTGK